MVFHPPETDPFYELMKPPPNETPAQMTARMKREADAQRVSDAIDEDIKHARNIQRKERSIVKLLLLGQAESGTSLFLRVSARLLNRIDPGKSTTLKSKISLAAD